MPSKLTLITIAASITLSGCSQKSIPLPSDNEISTAISQSDDFSTHKQAFINASKILIGNGTCTLHDLQYMGGFVKSQEFAKSSPVYFTYCGKMDSEHKIYLDAEDVRIFK